MEPEPQPEPKINTEKIEDVDVQAKIAEQEVNNAEVETDGKAHKDINNQIENIISDIDINIKAQEKITQLKEQELQLIQKQQELANQIQQQQLLAQRLIAQNRLQEQELQQQQMQQQQLPQQQQHQQFLPQQEAAPKLTQEYTKSYSRQEDSYDSKESSNMSRTFDLRKIFTPATDAPQILPKNRKLYASSAFYSPTLHPTVEDQVELARRISHSLSDISNQKSKGQSMYVNRKKRSVKWVHEASGQDYQQYQARPPTSPNLLPAYSDAGKHRVQLNLHQDQLIEKYSKPGVQVVKSPWEAALQTGSASTAFLDGSNYRSQTPTASLASPVNFNQDVIDYHQGLPSASKCSPSPCIEQNLFNKTKFDTPIQACNPQRELAYKPTVAQGWGGRNVELPRGLYVPKEISLSSYAPPPVQSRDQQQRSYNFPGSTNVDYSQSYQNSPTEFPISTPTNPYSSVPPKQQLYGPQSYQKVPPISMQSAPQVNFNPSPLSFDKLAKFQESAPNQLYLNVNNQMSRYGSGVRNASPTPFGSTGNIDHRSTPIKSPQQHFGGYGQNITHSAPLTMSPKVRSAPGQCFNNSARGWSAGSTVPQRNIYCPRVPVVAEGLPYSDF
ncbi:mediator of RNA polymerase II transcription subunit 15 isoform X10 [Drosophila grimshawi]|uniref:mediator of RNA polymerase II transcription subunit 15 isoform X10 n=1 Tax=Drosophila grimshawi TaxID=7222 RepID=UPI001C932B85|nr:mediator of RNA polymerase II transcription subunit 15 isoform X10 [Drosophila grimshawi]